MTAFAGPLKRLSYQLLFLLGCYFTSRCIFTLLHLQYFEGLGFFRFLYIAFAGIRFDIAALLVVNSIYIFLLLLPYTKLPGRIWTSVMQGIFLVTNTAAFLFEMSDWAYFPFNHKRATADVLNLVLRKGDFLNLLPGFLADYWYVPSGAALFIYIFIRINKKIVAATPFFLLPKRKLFAYTILRVILVSGLGIIGIRGGFQQIPIGIRNAVEVADSRYAAIALNTPFSIITTWQNDRLEEEKYFDEATLKQYITTTKHYAKKPFTPKNVVVIMLESFSKEFTGIGGQTSYTPFLDSLMGQSFVCTNAFANCLHSAEGIPAILAGIPALQEEPFTTSAYGANRITSITNLLSKKGYSSTFYHGGTNGTMSFDLFAANAGFQHYKGRSQYPHPSDYDGHWGIWDEPFLQYAVNDIGTNLKQPFCAAIFTLSSHYPYGLPVQYKDTFPKGSQEIHQTIGYTDHALRRFFAAAQMQSWYQNTLFVLVPDHCSPLSGNEYYHYFQGRYAIPIIYFTPGDPEMKGTSTALTQQIDILPSVMDYLGYQDSFFAFGNSIFSPIPNRYTVQFASGNFFWMMNHYLLRTLGSKPEGFFDQEKDPLNKDNLLQREDSLAQNALLYLRAMRQAYSKAMIYNELWVK